MKFSFRDLLFKNKPYKIAETLECGFLNVGNGHTVYYETAGNPEGIPVVILHGGPGVGLSHGKRRYYNPSRYYMIHFDQRGCGKSTPALETENNNTTALIEDMELLRKKLGIKKWVVAGGSWGSTLALAYSLVNKDKVLGLIINGIFTATKQEIDTVYSPKGVAAQMFPEQFAKFIEPLTKTEARNPLKSYIARIDKAGGIEKQYLLRTFLRWEWLLCVMEPNFDYIDKSVNSEDFDTSLAALEIHYFKNDHFLEAKEMVDSLGYLSDLPVYIAQGRYDMLCNPVHAHNVHSKIEGSKLVFTFDGHSIQSKAGHKVITGFANELADKLEEENNV
tara:strand:+ start:3616 stop:4617 length:1002 start_codon:yes stop_codon:yes gene_type:complete